MAFRPATPADVPFLVEVVNDPVVVAALSLQGARDEERLAEEIARGERYVLLDGAAPAGTAGLRVVWPRMGIASVFGVGIHPRHREHGVARRGLAALLAHALDDLGLHRVELEALGDNPAAIALFRSLGLVEEGARRRAWHRRGAWQDGVRFALLAEDPRPSLTPRA